MRHALDLFSFEGKVSRRQYLAAGVILLALKYGLDLAISSTFGEPWNPLMYVSPRVSPILRSDVKQSYLIALLVAALPFMWMGVSLTVRRLRDAGLSPFWAGLFFLPFLHFAFFLGLAFVPQAKQDERPPTPDAGPFRDRQGAPLAAPPPPRMMTRLIPRSFALAYLLGVLCSLSMGLLSYVVSVQLSRVLGTFMFIGLPFGMGFFTAFACTWGRPSVGGWRGVWYGVSPVAISLLLLIGIGWEGVACIIMAFPILGGIAALGAWVGWLCARTPAWQLSAPALLLLLPALLGADLLRPPAPAPLSVVSTVTVAAPPDVVWKNVISFPPIDARPAPIFAIVAMPIEARIDGHDPGATRRCVFTNGTFVEPIQVWDAPRELTFGVETQPDHLDEYIAVEKGQFLLSANPDGTTTLRGTTWYRLKVFPTGYWSAWAQVFLHAIHLRVLDHVKKLSEQPAAPIAAAAAMPDWMQASNATCDCTRHRGETK
jgi:uncharacterized membrane protein YhaH (DUF805 family)